MKQFYLFLIAFIFSISASAQFVDAQIIGTDAYARGQLVEIGINQNGTFGASEGSIPAGYHGVGRGAGGLFGFIANPQNDGWVDFDGDYFTPGSPEEGFTIKIDGTIHSNNTTFLSTPGIPGSITGTTTFNDCLSSFAQITWEGLVDGIRVQRTYTVSQGGLFIRMETNLTNVGSTTKSNIFWAHNVDPDNNERINGSFQTDFEIIDQASSATDNISRVCASQNAMAGSTAPDADGSIVCFYSEDARARVTFNSVGGGLDNPDGEAIWNGTGGAIVSAEGATATGLDVPMSLAVNVGDLAPGQSTDFTYYYILEGTDDSLTSFSLDAISPTVCDDNEPALIFSGLTAGDTYDISYLLDGVLVGPTSYTADATGTINITPAAFGIYRDVTIEIAGCTSVQPGPYLIEDLEAYSDSILTGFEDSYFECDDNDDGILTFDFSVTTTNIQALFAPVAVSVTYYESEANLDAGAPTIDPTSHTNTASPNTQSIWVKVTRNSDGQCVGKGEYVQLIVEELPTIGQPDAISLCDDDQDGLLAFDVSGIETTVLNGQSLTDVTVTYYNEDTTLIGTSLPNPFITSTQTITIVVANNSTSNPSGIPCQIQTTMDFTVENLPTATAPGDVIFCDDDQDGIFSFDTSTVEATVLNGQSLADVTVTYYNEDGTLIGSTLPNPFVTSTQTIDIFVTNNTTDDPDGPCQAQTTMTFTVENLPVVVKPDDVALCDDDQDGFLGFDVSSVESTVLDGQSLADVTVTYYNEDGSLIGTTLPNPFVTDTQTITITVTNNTTINPSGIPCEAQTTMMFTVENLPTATAPGDLAICDDDQDGIVGFDISTVETTVLNGQSLIDVTITYFNEDGSLIGTSLPNPFLTETQTITIVVSNNENIATDAPCEAQTTMSFFVDDLPEAIKPDDINDCDDDHDGILGFDTTGVEATVLNGQSLTDVMVEYFNEDGTSIGTTLPNPFVTASQTIDIVVTNLVTSNPFGPCTNSTTLTFTVDDLPTAATSIIIPVCDDDPDDGVLVATFDTTNLELDALNGEVGMNIFYLDSFGNALTDANGNPISSPFPATFVSTTQTITAVVQNPINGDCIAEATIDFEVLPFPVFDLMEEELVCENILPHVLTAENPQDVYTYMWHDNNGNIVGNAQSMNIVNTDDITEAGVPYTVTATNPVTGCTRTKTIIVKKSSIANISYDDITTIEFSNPNNSIIIDTTNIGFGDYEFALEHIFDDQPWQSEPIFENLAGGIYTLLVRDVNGCGQISFEIQLLEYPRFFTPNNDGENDTWHLIGSESPNFTSSPIQIFDRMGKIIHVLDPNGIGWDGTYLGKELPSTDYWFTLELLDANGDSKLHRGHFSLIRRE